MKGKTRELRTIPIDKTVTDTSEVMPYESAEAIIKSAKHISVADCMCRKISEVKGEPCDRPMEVCLQFDGATHFQVKGAIMISAEERYAKKEANVLGYTMRYVDEGSGDPIVFLHGNPTSSYLWRNIIPHLSGLGRCIAPDLIGMGDSDKLIDSGPESYTFIEHRKYLDALLEEIGITENVVFVIHDWGSALGFDWTYRHPDKVKGLVYMEAVLFHYEWSDWPEDARKIFQGFRSPVGEKLILEKNYFIELVLPNSVIREVSPFEMDVYRRPFQNAGEDRRPTLTWPRQIPIEGEPKEVVEIVTTYAEWLSKSDIPKLFINADPGSILVGRARDFCRSWQNQEEFTVKGRHFIQEDSPDKIGQSVAGFIRKIDQ